MKLLVEKMFKLNKGQNVLVPHIHETDIDLSAVDPAGIYCTTTDENKALELYEQYDKIVVAQKPHEEVVSDANKFGLALIETYGSKQELAWYINRVFTSMSAVVIRFDDGVYHTLEDMTDQLLCLGVMPLRFAYEDGKTYMVAQRTDPKGTKGMSYRDYEEALSSIIDVRLLKKHDALIRCINGFSSPWWEANDTGWRMRYFEKHCTVREDLRARLYRKRYEGQPIMMPNPEQAAVLLASGRLKGLIETDDGRELIVKGTEVIKKVTRTKRSLNDEPEAVRVIDQKTAAIVALDMQNGEFVWLS